MPVTPDKPQTFDIAIDALRVDHLATCSTCKDIGSDCFQRLMAAAREAGAREAWKEALMSHRLHCGICRIESNCCWECEEFERRANLAVDKPTNSSHT